MGILVIVDVLLKDRIPPDCDLKAKANQPNFCIASPTEGNQVLYIVLKRADGGDPGALAEKLWEASKGTYVMAGDGSRRNVVMAGDVVGLGPAVIFGVPTAARDFKLFWPGNPAIELGK